MGCCHDSLWLDVMLGDMSGHQQAKKPQAAARDAADGQDEGCWALRALNVDKLSRGQCCVEQGRGQGISRIHSVGWCWMVYAVECGSASPGEAGKSRRRSLSCCARRRPKDCWPFSVEGQFGVEGCFGQCGLAVWA